MMDISKYIGLPFLSCGRDPVSGIDCWGLVCLFYRQEYGLELNEHASDYQDTEAFEEMHDTVVNEASEAWQEISHRNVRLGDVVVFNVSGYPVHVGIVLNKTEMLHITDGVNASKENYQNMRWKRRVSNFYRHKGMVDANSR